MEREGATLKPKRNFESADADALSCADVIPQVSTAKKSAIVFFILLTDYLSDNVS